VEFFFVFMNHVGHAGCQVAASGADIEDFGACFEEGREEGKTVGVLEGGLGGRRGKERGGRGKEGRGKGRENE
jgi:hypothetical protein